MQWLQAKKQRLSLCPCSNLQQFNALKALEDPAHRGSGRRLVDLIGDGLSKRSQLLTQPMFRQAVDQQCEHHDQTQCHNAFRFFHKTEEARNNGSFRKRKPRSTLPCCRYKAISSSLDNRSSQSTLLAMIQQALRRAKASSLLSLRLTFEVMLQRFPVGSASRAGRPRPSNTARLFTSDVMSNHSGSPFRLCFPACWASC